MLIQIRRAEEVNTLIRAKYPILYIVSWAERRKKIFGWTVTGFYRWTTTVGIRWIKQLFFCHTPETHRHHRKCNNQMARGD